MCLSKIITAYKTSINTALPQVFFSHILRTAPKTFDPFQNSSSPLNFFDISLCTIQMLVIDKPNES